MVYLVKSVAQTRHDTEKRFSVPLKGVKNKACSVKNLAFKFSLSAPPKVAIFPKFPKIMFNHFKLFLTFAISIVHNDIFIFDNVISISLKVPSIAVVLPMGS